MMVTGEASSSRITLAPVKVKPLKVPLEDLFTCLEIKSEILSRYSREETRRSRNTKQAWPNYIAQ